MSLLSYQEALDSLDDKLNDVYHKHGLTSALDISRLELFEARTKIDLSLEDKQILKEHFKDIVHNMDARGDQSKVSL